MKILNVYLSTLLLITTACEKDLSLATKYDNSQSKIIPDPNENYNPNDVTDWGDFTMTGQITIPQSGVDLQGFWPDGKISVVEDSPGKFVLFWGEKYSIRTEGDTPYPEYHISQVVQGNRVFGAGIDEQDGFNDGGSWITGVHKLSDGRWVGFFHAESHWEGNTGIEAYKSIGVTYSPDKGRTWTEGVKILNVNYLKPNGPTWSGLGDGCVVYNEAREQFICYYTTTIPGEDAKICMAASDDPNGAAGSWKKWDGTGFNVEGYNSVTDTGGADTKIDGLNSHSGGNPSVMYIHYLKKWLMVYAGWDKVIYLSKSDDGIAWEDPIALTDASKETAAYANLIGDEGDLEGGKTVKLYYARNQNSQGVRQLAYRIINFK